ncbi:TPA: porin OmpC [Salmonella enterica]|uniref:Porin OmpC n=1 Tax=Salmonella enterica TaxID=28901 RepID=A0A754BA86_SALER|nr:porin OmpC [Salmonella enterica]ECU9162097.1 porin [Salmonella enterica subsp. enterica serovar Newport str. CFSAN000599]EDU1194340.1 porin OmpC [Salmonella enterica subsp. enterica serovar Heidelberg str. CFSAN000576]HAF8579485.1 porin OmpC [Salmonella enterica]
MKKLTVALSAVAAAILMSGMANAAEIYNKDGNKLDLYGKADARHQFSKHGSDDGDKTYVRFGFKGETQINDQLTGFGQWEYNIQGNNSEGSDAQKGNATRLAFAGLKFGDAGSLDYGRNYGVVYDIESWTDMLPVFGGDTYSNSDNFMTSRANNLLTYRNKDFFGLVDGLNFSLQYQGKNGGTKGGIKESNNSRDVKGQNGDGFGLSAVYNIDGFSAGTAYSNSDLTNEQQPDTYNHDGKRAEAWTAGLKYDANNIYLAAMYARTRNMTWVDIGKNSRIAKNLGLAKDSGAFTNKTDNWEVVAQYQFDFGLRPSIAYLQSKARDPRYGDIDLVKYTDIGATYYFNKNMSAYVDYKINLLKNDNPAGLSTDNIVGTGLVYQF